MGCGAPTFLLLGTAGGDSTPTAQTASICYRFAATNVLKGRMGGFASRFCRGFSWCPILKSVFGLISALVKAKA